MTWDVAEITLKAHYLKHEADTVTIACRSVSEVAGEYIDDVAADGGVMRSEIEPPTLMVRGIDPRAFEAIVWKPTHLLFEDPKTREQKEFSVRPWHTAEPNAAKFAIRG